MPNPIGRFQGPAVKRVVVVDVDMDRMITMVREGGQDKLMVVTINVIRTPGRYPQVGETWMIDRSLGPAWTYAALVGPEVDPLPPYGGT